MRVKEGCECLGEKALLSDSTWARSLLWTSQLRWLRGYVSECLNVSISERIRVYQYLGPFFALDGRSSVGLVGILVNVLMYLLVNALECISTWAHSLLWTVAAALAMASGSASNAYGQ